MARRAHSAALLTALLLLLAAAAVAGARQEPAAAPPLKAEPRERKVPVCHYDAETDSYALLMVAVSGWQKGHSKHERDCCVPGTSPECAVGEHINFAKPCAADIGIDYAAKTCVPRCPTPKFAAPAAAASAGTPVTFMVEPVAGATAYAWSAAGDGVAVVGDGATASATFTAVGARRVCVAAAGGCGAESLPACVDVEVGARAEPGSRNFTFTGVQEAFTVPPGVTSVTIEAWGAQGGGDYFSCNDYTYTGKCDMPTNIGGLGGYAKGTYAVTPGEALQVLVGGRGQNNGPGGWNGGGAANTYAGSGGGASEVRQGCRDPGVGDRIIVAGGGGGGYQYRSATGDYFYEETSAGGAGGGLEGAPGGCRAVTNSPLMCERYPGGSGGTQDSGGAASNTSQAVYMPIAPTAGTLGRGGGFSCEETYSNYCGGYVHIAGGGGGYYGGGGAYFAGGGGGSSYLGAGTNTMTEPGKRAGDGEVRISW